MLVPAHASLRGITRHQCLHANGHRPETMEIAPHWRITIPWAALSVPILMLIASIANREDAIAG
jgi:hypothetical protein